MARRRNNGSVLAGLAFVCVIAIPVLVLRNITEALGPTAFFILCVMLLSCVIAYFFIQKRNRLTHLRSKYRDEVIVQRIMQRQFWQGQTDEQLRDSLGDPSAADYNLLKTKKREVWKFQPTGKNRYNLMITLENDVVVGWDQKH